jgi:hypothetical protein
MVLSEKYCKIRERFLADFYYQGTVADRIADGKGEIKFGDQTVYMGQALIFLASEVPILKSMGKDISEPIRLITEILDAVDTLDDEAESYYGYQSSRNGFIVRDNFKAVSDPRLGGRWKSLLSDGQNPGNNSPSGDQLFGLLYGLWFVNYFAATEELANRAKELADRIYLFAMKCKFFLRLPDGKPTRRGADCQWLSSLLHGLARSVSGKDRFTESKIDVKEILEGAPGGISVIPNGGQLKQLLDLLPSVEIGLQGIASFWDNIGAEAAGILGTEIQIPIVKDIDLLKDFKIKVKSFSAHIILMAIAPTEIWSADEFEKAALSVNHHLAALWNALVHNKKPAYFSKNDVETILEACPDTGPQSGLPVKSGWQTDNRWIRCSDIHEQTVSGNRYFGVDFLMLHNLKELVFE